MGECSGMTPECWLTDRQTPVRRRPRGHDGIASVGTVPIDPARLNAVGDFVVTEVAELRALADPVRIDLFGLVRRDGPLAVEHGSRAWAWPRTRLRTIFGDSPRLG